DVTHIEAQLEKHREALRQVAMADRLLLTKCDLAEPEARERIAARLANLNPAASQVEVFGGDAPAEVLSGCGLYDPAGKLPDVASWLGESKPPERPRYVPVGTPVPVVHHHDDGVTSFVLTFDAPLDWLAFSEALELLLAARG